MLSRAAAMKRNRALNRTSASLSLIGFLPQFSWQRAANWHAPSPPLTPPPAQLRAPLHSAQQQQQQSQLGQKATQRDCACVFVCVYVRQERKENQGCSARLEACLNMALSRIYQFLIFLLLFFSRLGPGRGARNYPDNEGKGRAPIWKVREGESWEYGFRISCFLINPWACKRFWSCYHFQEFSFLFFFDYRLCCTVFYGPNAHLGQMFKFKFYCNAFLPFKKTLKEGRFFFNVLIYTLWPCMYITSIIVRMNNYDWLKKWHLA